MNKILLFVAGVEPDLIEVLSSTDRTRFSSIGISLLSTAILALVSGGYGLSLVLGNTSVSILFSIVYGLIIFNLDRLTIVSLYKSSNISKNFSVFIPRIILAVFLAFVIAQPILIKIFQSEIDFKFSKDQIEFSSELRRYYESEISTSEGKISEYDSLLNAKKRSLDDLQERYSNEITGVSGTGKKGDGPIARRLEEEYDQALNEYRNYSSNLNEQKAIQYKRITSLNREADSLANKLLPQVVKSNSLIGRIQTLEELKEENSTIRFTSFLLTFIFILIEIIPSLIWVLSPSKDYIELLEKQYEPEAEGIYESGKIEETSNQSNNNLVKEITPFISYFKEMRITIELQIDFNEERANKMFNQGLIIIFLGILIYIGFILYWMTTFRNTGFQSFYIYGILSTSLLFLFFEFLGGWFLKQHRKILNESLFLRNFIINNEKLLLRYLVVNEFDDKEKKEKGLLKLIGSIRSEKLSIDNQFLLKNVPTFATEVLEAFEKLQKTIKK